MRENHGAKRVIVFGDEGGAPMACRHVDDRSLVAIVASALRPDAMSALKAVAGARGVPLHVQPRRRDPGFESFLSRVEALTPDLIVVNSYGMKLPHEVFSLARVAAVNMHGGLLPEYRTAHPIQWAMVNGERETGATLHHVSRTMDAGDVIAQRSVPIAFDDTWQDVHVKLASAMDAMLAEQLPAIAAGTAASCAQDESRARSYPRRTRADDRIDWTQPVRNIYNLVRARVHPHDGAFFVDAAGRQVVLDRFLTITEVAAMKWGGEGDQRLDCDGFEARCVAGRDRRPTRVTLEISRRHSELRRAIASICDIDWTASTARIAVSGDDADPGSHAAALTICRRVAADEFGLASVCAD